MSNRWVCPYCGALSERVYPDGEGSNKAYTCPDCSWVHLHSFWATTSVPDGVMTIRERGGFQIGNAACWRKVPGETEVL